MVALRLGRVGEGEAADDLDDLLHFILQLVMLHAFCATPIRGKRMIPTSKKYEAPAMPVKDGERKR